MAFELSLFNNSLMQKQNVEEILEYNEVTQHYGLVLTETQAIELSKTRADALRDNGRIELGSGVIGTIIREFCDSPYMSMYGYEETLQQLIEMFYYYKNETLDLISDDDLIRFMKTAFNGVCQGSLELLESRELDVMAHNLRFGLPFDYVESDPAPDDDEKDDDGEY